MSRSITQPDTDVGQLSHTSLRDQARNAIRANIVTGEIRAGAIHSVGSLATRYGVSPTPIREALLDLANEGLIEMIRNRGFRVPMLTDADLDELFELRLMLEVPAVTRLAGKLSREDLAVGRTHAERIESYAAEGNLAAFLQADRDFHMHLLNCAGNGRLVEIVDRLRNQTRLYGLPSLARFGQLTQSAHEHINILDAIERGDAETTRTCMTRHLEHTRGIWAGRIEGEQV